MRWLNGRGRQERGAVAVVVAICMVVLMGFLAIAVDVGSIYSDKQQLQNGADAGALAIAESCQRGSCVDTANKYVMANKLDGQAIGTAVINQTAGSVTVEATSTHQNWFAGVLGRDLSTTTIRAQAIATYGSPVAGPTLPLTFSWCVFHDATGKWFDNGTPMSSATVKLYLKEQKPPPKSCAPSAVITVPGGFSWVDTATSTDCVANVVNGQWLQSNTGYDLPAACKNVNWVTLQTQPVFLPIFDATNGLQGNYAKYEVKGFAAFQITGYCFTQAVQWQWDDKNCPANNKGILGKFIQYYDRNDKFITGPGATNFGTSAVKLSG